MTQEALKLALEFLEDNQDLIEVYERPEYLAMYKAAIDKCKEALAQPEQEPWCMKMNGCKTKCEDCPVEVAQPEQEPVADDFFRMIADRNPKPFSSLQRTWVGLTDVEIEQAIELISMLHGDYATEVAYAIQAKLKEKNT